MPTVKHRKAAKDYPEIGVKAGEMYYSWRMRTQAGGVKRISKTPPKPSQLTLSEFKSQWRAFAEEIDDLPLDSDLYDNLQQIAARMRELGDEQSEKKDGMPDGLQQGDTGQMLETRADNCNSWADVLEGLDEPDAPDEEATKSAVERESGQTDEEFEAAKTAAYEEAVEAYNEKLQEIKDEAAQGDPGEE
jgi:hypothetical protein